MTQINAYIGFNGQCREAMTFYKECLGGELSLMTVEESPIAAQCPGAIKGQIVHSMLVNGGMVLMGSDMTGPDGYTKGNNIALSVNCSSEEEINTFYNKLSEGGRIVDPLKEQFWGALFGVVADKYGITWMFNYDKNQNA
jgi:PhnB protein